jgi:putative hydrolase of the HAD superfamily
MSEPAFLFDIGNVLVRFDFTHALLKLANMSSVPIAEVPTLLEPLKDALECGGMSDDDFITQSIAKLGFKGGRNDFIELWGDIFTEHKPMTALVEKLADDYPLYLFSNTSGLHKEWLFERFEVFRHFKDGVYSYEARSSKPAECMYRDAIRRFNLDPAQTFYIDDLPDNIATGRRLGFLSHQYEARHHDKLEQEVEAFLASTARCC